MLRSNGGVIGNFKENKREKLKKIRKKFFFLKKVKNISRNLSGAVGVSVGSVQFQIAPHSSLHLSISIGPFWCSQCSLQGF